MIKDFFKFSFGSWISAFISFFTTPLITLFISPENFGIAALFNTTSAILLQVILLGTDQSFIRFFYEYEEILRPKLLWNSLIPSVLWGGICISVLFFCRNDISEFLFESNNTLLVGLLGIDLFVKLIDRFTSLVFRMQKRGVAYSLQRLGISLLNAICIIIYCLYVEKNFYAIIIASIISTAIMTLLAIFIEKKFWFYHVKISKVLIRQILIYGFPLIFASLLGLIFQTMDKYFLKFFSDFEQLGLYTASFKIVGVLALVQSGFSVYWIPVSFEHYEKYPNDKCFYEKIFHCLYVFLIPIALLLILFKDFIILILGWQYRQAATIMPFLIFIPVLYTLAEVTCLGIYFKKKTIWQTYIALILVIGAVILNYLLISKWGAKGASLSIAIVYILYFYLRTFVSIHFFSMNFQLLRISVYLLLLFVVAWVNTFIDTAFYGYCSALFSLIFFLFVERKKNVEIVNYIYYRLRIKKSFK